MKKSEKVIIFSLIGIFILMVGFLLYIKNRSKIISATTGYIYLLTHTENNVYIVPVVRKIPYRRKLEKKVRFLIEKLIEGPTPEEKARGLSTAIPSGVKLLNVRIERNVVYLDFNEEIEKGGGTLTMEGRLAQIVYTATQFPEIEKVRFLIGGKFIKYFSGEGITEVENPVDRKTFSEFVKQKEEK